MDQYRCKLCGNILTRGEDHPCFFHKKFDYMYLLQRPVESDKNSDEVKDKSLENSKCNSPNLSHVAGQNERKNSELINSSLFQNNEKDKSLPPKVPYRNSADNSSNAKVITPSDSLNVHPFSDCQVQIQVQTNENISLMASSENVESYNRQENEFFEAHNRAQTATGSSGIDIQYQSGSDVSELIYATTDEECKMSLGDSKLQSLNKDKNDFMDALENVIRNALSDNNNVSGTAHSTVNPDLPPGSNEPKNSQRQVSEGVNDEHISPEGLSQSHSKNDKVCTYVKEPTCSIEDDNAVAGPSGMCSRKNFPRTPSNLCPKEFKRVDYPVTHYRTHTGEKPYVCDICGKQCSQKSHLITHYRTHTGDKPFVCDVCNKGFAQKGNLRRHIRMHTGEKPYKCPACEKSFTNSGDCKKHHKRKHE